MPPHRAFDDNDAIVEVRVLVAQVAGLFGCHRSSRGDNGDRTRNRGVTAHSIRVLVTQGGGPIFTFSLIYIYTITPKVNVGPCHTVTQLNCASFHEKYRSEPNHTLF